MTVSYFAQREHALAFVDRDGDLSTTQANRRRRPVVEAELAEAGRLRAEAELRALKAELSPHFLGNALQGVKALMRTDVDAAQRALAPLADILRSTLSRGKIQETLLRD